MEPWVTLQQLEHLLSLGREAEDLDYKRECKLSDVRSLVELAKDVAAMQINGGYIVVGANNDGTVAHPGVPDDQHKLFDEAALRSKLSKWIPSPFVVHTAIHSVAGSALAMIAIEPRPDGFCVFAQDGAFQDGNNRTQTVFRAGEVYARHGTSSERWNQSDIQRIRKRIVVSEKEGSAPISVDFSSVRIWSSLEGSHHA